ncbi:MAG: Uma2 family endonuclease [Phycisphaerales bacterium]|nr:Uma2 family endonuclease [Phycisphaerales bacterium]
MVVRDVEFAVDEHGQAQFSGMRMTVDEFLSLPDDGGKYELVDGVVLMSPWPSPPHQKVAGEIFAQIKWFLRTHALGEVFMEIDVHLGRSPAGGDLVYGPDVIFVRSERVRSMHERIVGPPDLVVEVVSPGSRGRDTITKRGDYERFGVGEYWIIDPARDAMTFLRLQGGQFVEVNPNPDTFASHAVAGFVLDLKPIRDAFKPW